MPSKQTKIDAIKWFYGYTTKEAESYYRTAGSKAIDEITRGYLCQARNSFYDD